MDDPILGLFRSNLSALDSITGRNLFLSFRKLVYRNVYFILGDPSLTEDAIQEVFLKAMKHGPKLPEEANMSGWLKRIARNTALDVLKKNKKYRQTKDIDDVIVYEDESAFSLIAASAEDAAVRLAQQEQMAASLSLLKPEYRVVLALRYIEELTYREMANELGMSEEAVGKRLERARRKLAKIYKEQWEERS